ncbi:MAG: AtpZ/AtpI family protein [Phyllobacteriaceae bacterium]|nr:AtpZ/AtpI family protein [Phyllobacteriaceae bacterium]
MAREPKLPGSADGGGPDDGELARRLERLSQKLDDEKREQAVKDAPAVDTGNAALVFRFASEFVAGVLVGGLIGWGIDWALGTKPIAMIVFLLLGFAAALTNMVRVAKAAQAGVPVGQDMPAGDEDEDA